MNPRVCVLLLLASATAAGAVKRVKLAQAKPLNFTALFNGDAMKRKVASIKGKIAQDKKDHEERKLKAEKEREEAAAKREAMPKAPGPDISGLFEHAAKKLEQKIKDKVQEKILNNQYLNGTWIENKIHKHDHDDENKLKQCVFPFDDDKVVYFIQGAMTSDELDSELTEEGVQQAKQLPKDIRFERALGNGTGRAQVVIVGPMRKTLQTAFIAFGDKLPDAKWEINMDVRGIKHESEPIHPLGMSLLSNLSAPKQFIEQYDKKVMAGDHGNHEARWHRFIDHMRSRPEHTFIVVTHNYGCVMTQLDIPIGEARIGGLLKNPIMEFDDIAYGGNAWHELSSPQCWPKNITM